MQRWVNANQDAHWDKRSFYRDAHDPAAEAFTVPKLDWLCDRLDINPDATLLDVGAGTGVFTYWWSQRLEHVTGLELSENMIGRSAVPELMRIGNAYEIPFDDDAFDFVFAGNLLHHLDRPVAALEEMRRVARRGVAIVECNRNHPPMAVFASVSSVCRGILHYTRVSCRELAEQAGLTVVDVRLHGYIYENRSPTASVPIARRLEHHLNGGAYILLAATS